MTKKNATPKYNEAFCELSDWQPYLPAEFRDRLQSKWRLDSRNGRWAPYMNLDGKFSATLWRKTDIMGWFRLKFGTLFPESVESLRAAGFKDASEEPKKFPFKHNRKRKMHNV